MSKGETRSKGENLWLLCNLDNSILATNFHIVSRLNSHNATVAPANSLSMKKPAFQFNYRLFIIHIGNKTVIIT